MTASEAIARLSVVLQIPPPAILASPPRVVDELFVIARQQADEQDKARRESEHQARLARLRGG